MGEVAPGATLHTLTKRPARWTRTRWRWARPYACWEVGVRINALRAIPQRCNYCTLHLPVALNMLARRREALCTMAAGVSPTPARGWFTTAAKPADRGDRSPGLPPARRSIPPPRRPRDTGLALASLGAAATPPYPAPRAWPYTFTASCGAAAKTMLRMWSSRAAPRVGGGTIVTLGAALRGEAASPQGLWPGDCRAFAAGGACTNAAVPECPGALPKPRRCPEVDKGRRRPVAER